MKKTLIILLVISLIAGIIFFYFSQKKKGEKKEGNGAAPEPEKNYTLDQSIELLKEAFPNQDKTAYGFSRTLSDYNYNFMKWFGKQSKDFILGAESGFELKTNMSLKRNMNEALKGGLKLRFSSDWQNLKGIIRTTTKQMEG